MEQFKRAKMVMLPTEDKTNISLNKNNTAVLRDTYTISQNDEKYQHLYIISDDEIKEGDLFIYNNELLKCTGFKNSYILVENSNYTYFPENSKKIIATTDTSLKYFIDGNGNKSIHELTKSGYVEFLPQPSQQFIEKYIESYNKGEVITDILVEYETIKSYELDRNSREMIDYKTKLKVNPKDNTITIKKIKDSWNRNEVKAKLFELLKDISDDETLLHHYDGDYREFNTWIKENL